MGYHKTEVTGTRTGITKCNFVLKDFLCRASFIYVQLFSMGGFRVHNHSSTRCSAIRHHAASICLLVFMCCRFLVIIRRLRTNGNITSAQRMAKLTQSDTRKKKNDE